MQLTKKGEAVLERSLDHVSDETGKLTIYMSKEDMDEFLKGFRGIMRIAVQKIRESGAPEEF